MTLRRQPVRRPLAAFALLGVLAGPVLTLAACTLPPDAPTVIASATGTGPDDAYRVASVAQEYEVLRLLGLEARGQALHVLNGQRYDVIQGFNPATGETRDVWFDIARFSGRGGR